MSMETIKIQCQEELKLMQSLIKPKYFMPVHGEYRHLVEHSKLSQALGHSKDNIFILGKQIYDRIYQLFDIFFQITVPFFCLGIV